MLSAMMTLTCLKSHAIPQEASRRKLYIQQPEEDDTVGMVGRLCKTMYGTGDAAASCEPTTKPYAKEQE
eukprot:4512569-Amphidinium_carterae.1